MEAEGHDKRKEEEVMTAPNKGKSLTVVEAKPGIITVSKLKNRDNWRAILHQMTPVVVTVLTTLSITTADQAALWVALAFAFIDPLLSYSRATDKARKIVYAVGGLLQSGGLLAAVTSVAPGPAVPIISAVLTIATSMLSRMYTPTSTMLPSPLAPVVFPNSPWPTSP